MGRLVEEKTKEFVSRGLTKKEARHKAHEYCETMNTCRGCSQVIQPSWWSWKQGYCRDCMD